MNLIRLMIMTTFFWGNRGTVPLFNSQNVMIANALFLCDTETVCLCLPEIIMSASDFICIDNGQYIRYNRTISCTCYKYEEDGKPITISMFTKISYPYQF